jgi:dipeptidyl aminopeptidase/acylaminoacyl peptidase
LYITGPGGSIHALLTRPPAIGGAAAANGSSSALPTVFFLHGGPAAADEDSYDATRSAWLDAGFAVVQVNYRGSTGYGSAWRDALTARVGHTELADVAAVHDHLVSAGVVDPARSVLAGYSWGGFLTLLGLGIQPSRWAAGIGGVPVADYVQAYEDEMEPLRAYDRALFGGSPEDVPLAYRDSSPLTYVDQVRAPVLILAGENDPRCPIRQIDTYLDALAANGATYAHYRYDAGHGSMVVQQRIRQVACEIAFVRTALGMPGA